MGDLGEVGTTHAKSTKSDRRKSNYKRFVSTLDAVREHDDQPLMAQKLLEEIVRKDDIARSKQAEQAEQPAATWNFPMRNMLPSADTMKNLVKPLMDWYYGEPIEVTWAAEVRRAEEAQALREAHNQRKERERKTIAKHRSINASHNTALVDVQNQKTDATTGQDPSAGSICNSLPTPRRPAPPHEVLRAALHYISEDVQIETSPEASACNAGCSFALENDARLRSSSTSASNIPEQDTFSEGSGTQSSRSTSPSIASNSSCANKLDASAPDSDGMVLYGRWKHHKDAPLAHLKNMISSDMRGDPCSLFASGMMKLEDHPVLPVYRARLKAKGKEDHDLPLEPLSPTLMSGRKISHRSALRFATPITFSRTLAGTFKTTGFQKRPASWSTLDSAVDLPSENEASASSRTSNTTSNTLSFPPKIGKGPPKALVNASFDGKEPYMPLRTRHFERKLLLTKATYDPQPERDFSDLGDLAEVVDVFPPKPEAHILKEYLNEVNMVIVAAEDLKDAKGDENPFYDSDEEDEDMNGGPPSPIVFKKMPIRPLRKPVCLKKHQRQLRVARGPSPAAVVNNMKIACA
ncbi:hypothetical protein Q7P37_001406 [Cladosporium fusiforme]